MDCKRRLKLMIGQFRIPLLLVLGEHQVGALLPGRRGNQNRIPVVGGIAVGGRLVIGKLEAVFGTAATALGGGSCSRSFLVKGSIW